MIVVAALAVFVYDFYKRVDRQQARDEAALLREQTRLLQQQADQVNRQLQEVNQEAAALKNEVAGQRREDAERKEQQTIAAYLAEGLQLSAAVKAAIAESRQVEMKWPASNREAGLPDPSQLTGRSLRSMKVSGQGVIALTYDAKSGVEGGVIRLIPSVRGEGAVTWRCESPSYENIAIVNPQCSYRPGKDASRAPASPP